MGRGRSLRLLPPLIWALLILVLLLAPPRDDGPTWFYFPHADKLVHAVLFGVLAWLMLRSMRTPGIAVGLPLLVTVLACTVLFGGLTEWLQHVLPVGRTGDLGDLLADAVGVVIALLVARGR